MVEAVPVAAILLFWNLLAWVAQMQNVGGPVRDAGFIMAALYVVVRGVALSEQVIPPVSGDIRALLYENARIAVPAGVWFVAAMVSAALEVWVLGLQELLAVVTSALAGAGLGVVGLYAVAAGTAALGGDRVGGEETPDSSGVSSGDD